MKKIIHFILVILLVLSVVPSGLFSIIASAETIYTEGAYLYTVLNGEATIIDYNYEVTGNVSIPSTLGNYPVKNIGDFAFENCKKITKITIPDGVISIGDSAFYYCGSLTSITIPDSVTSIGNSVFERCGSLTSTTIPDSVTSIGNSAFERCDDLTSVTIGNSVTSIGNFAFYSCDSLKNIIIPDSVTSIGNSAFSFCNSLKSIIIPDSVTSIGDSAFFYCDSLESVIIGNGVTSIGDSAFYCDSLKKVSYKGSEQDKAKISIGDSNSYLTNATWYYNAEGGDFNGIFHYTFSNDKATIVGCNSSISGDVIIPSTLGGYNVTSIGTSAFENCEKITNITIPDSVTSIGNSAFEGCDSLTSITIPDSVTSIREGAFTGCYALTGVYITDMAAWCNISFEGYYGDANPLFYAQKLYLNGEIVTELVIPDGVTSVKNYTFFHCTSLTSVTIPDSIKSIGNSAFSFCNSLKSIIIPDSVTSIGDSAFLNCDSLTSVTIGNSVTSIGNSAFESCDSLKSVTMYNSVKSIEGFAFYYCSRLSNVYYSGSSQDIITIGLYNDEIIDATWHYYTCNEHIYNSKCDIICSVCGFYRNSAEHYYSDDCDTKCNGDGCDNIRIVYHNFEWIIDVDATCATNGSMHEECSRCYIKQNEGTVIAATNEHSYDNLCDIFCNICESRRNVLHDYKWVIDTVATCDVDGIKHEECIICSQKRNENTIISAKHIYDNNCDTDCNVCGNVRQAEEHKKLLYILEESFNKQYGTNVIYSSWENNATMTITALYDFTLTIQYQKSNAGLSDLLIIEQNSERKHIKQGNTGENGDRWESVTVNLFVGDKLYIKKQDQDFGTLSYSYLYVILSLSKIVSVDKVEVSCENDFICNVCGEVLEKAKGHNYENNCDTNCNSCNKTREVSEHIYDNLCDSQCNECGEIRGVSDHIYDNVCDSQCNECDNNRIAPHSYHNTCDTDCNGCGQIREVTDHLYDNNCDTECNICNSTRSVTHDYEWIIDERETCGEYGIKHQKCTICQKVVNEGTSITPTGNHRYFNDCESKCYICLQISREVGEHQYDNSCDTFCKECGFERQIEHIYGDDRICDVCGNVKYIPGDIDGDGKVNTTDLAVMKLYLAGLSNLNDTELLAGDLNEDGAVDTTDLASLKLLLAGIHS